MPVALAAVGGLAASRRYLEDVQLHTIESMHDDALYTPYLPTVFASCQGIRSLKLEASCWSNRSARNGGCTLQLDDLAVISSLRALKLDAVGYHLTALTPSLPFPPLRDLSITASHTFQTTFALVVASADTLQALHLNWLMNADQTDVLDSPMYRLPMTTTPLLKSLDLPVTHPRPLAAILRTLHALRLRDLHLRLTSTEGRRSLIHAWTARSTETDWQYLVGPLHGVDHFPQLRYVRSFLQLSQVVAIRTTGPLPAGDPLYAVMADLEAGLGPRGVRLVREGAWLNA
jgi:hypothetical protein